MASLSARAITTSSLPPQVSDTYDGSGGWVYSSGTGTRPVNGGMDVVDFRLSTVGVTANLSSTAAQATGFTYLDIYQYRGAFPARILTTL